MGFSVQVAQELSPPHRCVPLSCRVAVNIRFSIGILKWGDFILNIYYWHFLRNWKAWLPAPQFCMGTLTGAISSRQSFMGPIHSRLPRWPPDQLAFLSYLPGLWAEFCFDVKNLSENLRAHIQLSRVFCILVCSHIFNYYSI